MMDRVYTAAKRSGVDFAVATIPPSFNAPSRGPFDPVYMTALFQVGEDLGKSATPFANEPPPYPRPTYVTTTRFQVTFGESRSELMRKLGGLSPQSWARR